MTGFSGALIVNQCGAVQIGNGEFFAQGAPLWMQHDGQLIVVGTMHDQVAQVFNRPVAHCPPGRRLIGAVAVPRTHSDDFGRFHNACLPCSLELGEAQSASVPLAIVDPDGAGWVVVDDLLELYPTIESQERRSLIMEHNVGVFFDEIGFMLPGYYRVITVKRSSLPGMKSRWWDLDRINPKPDPMFKMLKRESDGALYELTGEPWYVPLPEDADL